MSIIDRKPLINSEDASDKTRLTNLEGDIEFANVSFRYPSREQVTVLNEISFKIKAGSTVALVGSSGCGKSTCIQLLQRFYDVIDGRVLIDNVDIKELELKWLRSQLGVVNQEPILFGTSIIENIRFGKENVSQDQIISAAKSANAHDFIMQLPQVQRN